MKSVLDVTSAYTRYVVWPASSGMARPSCSITVSTEIPVIWAVARTAVPMATARVYNRFMKKV